MDGLHLGETVHHVARRIACAGCGTRVFTFATATDDAGRVVADYCSTCAARLRGTTLCQYCQRHIKRSRCGTEWLHADGKVRSHPATPEVKRTYQAHPMPLQPQLPFVRRSS